MKKKRSKIKTVKLCPHCHSTNVTLWLGTGLGVQYKCKACGYIGPLIIEKDTSRTKPLC